MGLDRSGYEVIFRQPVNQYELDQVMQAAKYDPFAGYGIDGDLRWSHDAIRAWWAGRAALEQELAQMYEAQLALGERKDYHWFAGIARWRDYFAMGCTSICVHTPSSSKKVAYQEAASCYQKCEWILLHLPALSALCLSCYGHGDL